MSRILKVAQMKGAAGTRIISDPTDRTLRRAHRVPATTERIIR